MCSVLIMLSTYNGEEFLTQQLDSLYEQKNVDVFILARDDGSKDRTLEILNQYKKQYGKMTVLAQSNIGAAQSFFYLMYYAATKMPKFDFYAFSDQDDVWFENKLEVSTSCLNKGMNRPQLFFSEAQKVDIALNPVGVQTKIKVVDNLYAFIVSTHSLGCTQVYNYALLEQCVKIYKKIPDYISKYHTLPLHDGWIARVAYALDSDVFYYKEPLMFYRQHGNNVVGVASSKVELFFKRIKRYLFCKTKNKSSYCKYLLDLYSDEMSQKNLNFIRICAGYDESICNKLKLIFFGKIYQYDFFENVGLVFMIFFNRF